MTGWQIFSLILWTAVLGGLLIVLGQLAQKYRYSTVGLAMRSRSSKLVVAFALTNFVLILWPITREWWVERFFTHTMSLLALFGVFGYAMSLMEPNPKTQGRVGFALASLAFVCILYFLGAFDWTGVWWGNHTGQKDKTLVTTTKGASTGTGDGSTNPPFYVNMEEWRNDLGFWMSHAVKGDVTQEEAEWMAAYCAAESGCEQFEEDGVTVKRNPASSALGKYQILASLHKDEIRKFVEAGQGQAVDLGTPEGNRNFAYELVMSYKANKVAFDKDWAPTKDKAQQFLNWVHSLPPDSGDPNLRNPDAPLVARGNTPSIGEAPKSASPRQQVATQAVHGANKSCSITQEITLKPGNSAEMEVPSENAVLETSGDGMYRIRGWYRSSSESAELKDEPHESDDNSAGWSRNVGQYRALEVKTVCHSADCQPVTFSIRPCPK